MECYCEEDVLCQSCAAEIVYDGNFDSYSESEEEEEEEAFSELNLLDSH